MSDLKNEELKPCPFCGGKAIITSESLNEWYSYADVYYVTCENGCCSRSAMGDRSKGGYADNSKCEQQATDLWNTRANIETNCKI